MTSEPHEAKPASCCAATALEGSDTEFNQIIKDRYAGLACTRVCSDKRAAQQIADAFGYSAEELASIEAAIASWRIDQQVVLKPL